MCSLILFLYANSLSFLLFINIADRLFKQIAKDILQKAEAEKLKHANGKLTPSRKNKNPLLINSTHYNKVSKYIL